MIDYTPSLHPADCATLRQFDAFLTRTRASPDDWWVGPDEDASDHGGISVAYAERGDRRGLRATVFFGLADRRVAIVTDLHAALGFLAAMMDDPGLRARSSMIDAMQSPAEAQRRLGLDAPDLVTRQLGSQHEGYHLTRLGNDWLAYLVEVRVQVIRLAESDNPAALVFYLHACDSTQDSDLGERLAECMPDE